MRKIRVRVTLSLILAVVSTGCGVYSQNDLGAPDGSDAVFDAGLLGDWYQFDERSRKLQGAPVRIERESDKSNSYTCILPGNSGEADQILRIEGIRLIRLDGASFLDVPAKLVPIELGGNAGAKVIYRLRREGRRVGLDEISVSFLKEHPQLIRHEIKGLFKQNAYITATTAEVREFVRTIARNEAAWRRDGFLYQKVDSKVVKGSTEK